MFRKLAQHTEAIKSHGKFAYGINFAKILAIRCRFSLFVNKWTPVNIGINMFFCLHIFKFSNIWWASEMTRNESGFIFNAEAI